MEKPEIPSLLSSPTGWPVVCSPALPSAKAVDRELKNAGSTWFERPFAIWEKTVLSIPVMWGVLGLVKWAGQSCDKDMAQKIQDALLEHCVCGDYIIPPERHRMNIGDLVFWLTPLRSGISDHHTRSYYVVVRHNKLQLHPKRVVAFVYRPGGGLEWI